MEEVNKKPLLERATVFGLNVFKFFTAVFLNELV